MQVSTESQKEGLVQNQWTKNRFNLTDFNYLVRKLIKKRMKRDDNISGGHRDLAQC